MKRRRLHWERVGLHGGLAITALLFAAPVIWMLTMSLQTEAEIFQPIPHWWPQPITLSNYAQVLQRAEEAPVLRWFLNSVLVAGCGTGLTVLLASMAAYAFARLRFPGRDLLFWMVLSTLIIPGQVTIIPVFLILQKLHWFNTYQALIVPGLPGAFGVFLLRQFFRTIPRDLEEAARIDGCSHAGLYAHIILPLSRPALATLAIFAFLGHWNDFLLPLIAVNDTEMRTLPVGLTLFLGRYDSQYGLVMAVAVLASLPVILTFLLFQKHVIRGVVMTGLKG
ncbi:MAG: carbohydrate ABC transporter permease [Armatimonadetes bacterium]|nr:carbohydrate ABC transporter permease [Armatimonadota bacterium]